MTALDAERPDAVVGATASLWLPAASLNSILDDIRQRMHADTATLLLVDRTRSVLEPTATAGLDRTLRGAPPVPLGQGFAGRVAQTRQALALGEVNPRTVLNPVLLEHGVRALLGVPIQIGGELLGVLHVGWLQQTGLDAAAVLRLTELATALRHDLQRRFVDEAHSAALTLQRSLLPAALVMPPGLRGAARYVPAEGDLGGDWYDAFPLPGGRFALVMGDVVGHGLDAAVVMGRLRSTTRAYALEHGDPGKVVRLLDQKICHFEPNAFATMIYAVAEPPFERWLVSSAGHLAPIVSTPQGPPRQAEIVTDPLLGVEPDTVRQTSEIVVPDGGLLCLFTDGLVERRPGPHDSVEVDLVARHIERLCAALYHVADPETACIRALTQVVGDKAVEDDIALLVAQRATDPT